MLFRLVQDEPMLAEPASRARVNVSAVSANCRRKLLGLPHRSESERLAFVPGERRLAGCQGRNSNYLITAAFGRAAQSMLFQMIGADPAVLALSAVVLAVVALWAGFIPAHRASRVDPMRALKYE